MKLLICTQAVDENDPVLGFFIRWIEELSKQFEQVTVVCLRKGKYSLPNNVRVVTLPQSNRFARAPALLAESFKYRTNYDLVFVHMNQEYVLVAGWLWKLFSKKVYLWRNHYAGSFLTDIAAAFCTNVFCTSKYSYTAKYKKTIFMPVGVDTERFNEDARMARVPRSILWLARVAPSKRLEMLLDALEQLVAQGVGFSASIVGSPLPEHQAYYDALKASVEQRGLAAHVTFMPGVPNGATPDLYRAHEIFVNTSPSGMLDKTIFEAAACGCQILASSGDIKVALGPDAHFDSAARLEECLKDSLTRKRGLPEQDFVTRNSLAALAERLGLEMGLVA